MCGIIGYKFFSSSKHEYHDSLSDAIGRLRLRGPDSNGIFANDGIGFAQTRLSIIDPSEKGDQPMFDASGRYVLIFNGEIYNYKQLRLEIPNVKLKSASDTEILLYLLIHQGVEFLSRLNGFFAFAFYDIENDQLILARDRIGIKPLHYYQDTEQIVFASEMKALLEFPLPREINTNSLFWYLKLNYLPGYLSMLKGFKKLEPGSYLSIKGNDVQQKSYINEGKVNQNLSYEKSQNKLVELLDKSVSDRLISDVPLGSFLSGGLDSSAIVALASGHTSKLKTFSIGYKDHHFFDETNYAELVANKFRTDHTTFLLTNDDLLEDIDDIISYIDEPFADSSAIPVYILSKHTRNHVTVALSGDGADELLGGYYKHVALNRAFNPRVLDKFAIFLTPLLENLPKSRSRTFANTIRRLDRFGKMSKMNPLERYWFLASLTNDPSPLLKIQHSLEAVSQLKETYLPKALSMDDYFKADQTMLLPSDMLTKVDLMSMANSLEVRVPFLDKNIVDFARSLPVEYKLEGTKRKRILHDAFKSVLPKELYHRPKKGFEVPLLQWMRKELLNDLDTTLFNKEYIQSQGLFNLEEVMNLRLKLFSTNPHDVHAAIWALYIFQKWYMKYMD